MKCDYCEKEYLYSCGAYLEDKVVPIYACEEHCALAISKQQKLLRDERAKQRIEMLKDSMKEVTVIKP